MKLYKKMRVYKTPKLIHRFNKPYLSFILTDEGFTIKGVDTPSKKHTLCLRNGNYSTVFLPGPVMEAYNLMVNEYVETSQTDNQVTVYRKRVQDVQMPCISRIFNIPQTEESGELLDEKLKYGPGATLSVKPKDKHRQVFLCRHNCAWIRLSDTNIYGVPYSLKKLQTIYGDKLQYYPYETLTYHTEGKIVVPEWFMANLFADGSEKMFECRKLPDSLLITPFEHSGLFGTKLDYRTELPAKIEVSKTMMDNRPQVKRMIELVSLDKQIVKRIHTLKDASDKNLKRMK